MTEALTERCCEYVHPYRATTQPVHLEAHSCASLSLRCCSAVLLARMDWATVLAHLHDAAASGRCAGDLPVRRATRAQRMEVAVALRIHELQFGYGFLSRVLVIAFFLNNFLPTSIGGDAYRVYRTLPPSPPRSSAVSAVLLERVVGLSALLALGFVGALTLYSSNPLARVYVDVRRLRNRRRPYRRGAVCCAPPRRLIEGPAITLARRR